MLKTEILYIAWSHKSLNAVFVHVLDGQQGKGKPSENVDKYRKHTHLRKVILKYVVTKNGNAL